MGREEQDYSRRTRPTPHGRAVFLVFPLQSLFYQTFRLRCSPDHLQSTLQIRSKPRVPSTQEGSVGQVDQVQARSHLQMSTVAYRSKPRVPSTGEGSVGQVDQVLARSHLQLSAVAEHRTRSPNAQMGSHNRSLSTSTLKFSSYCVDVWRCLEVLVGQERQLQGTKHRQ